MTQLKKQFSSATTRKKNWEEATYELIQDLGTTTGRLGILYTSEDFAPCLGEMVELLKAKTSTPDWVSAAGYGIISQTEEVFGESAATALILDIPSNSYRLFSGSSEAGKNLAIKESEWITEATMPLTFCHVDPRRPDAMDAIKNLAEETGSFLIGGLTVASGDSPHMVTEEKSCISGVAISPIQTEILTGLSQGCSPISKTLTVTKVEENIIIELDNKPAFDVLIDSIGDEFNDNLQAMAGTIFIALPIPGSDTADYTVRNLVGLDPQNKIIAIAEPISKGEPLLFCRRDQKTAVDDMRRMTNSIKGRIGERFIRGGIYISCAARGPNQFSPPERETDIIRETLGDFPIAGFFANGEISRSQVYAYTGVLALFV